MGYLLTGICSLVSCTYIYAGGKEMEEPKCPSWFQYEYDMLQKLMKIEEEVSKLKHEINDLRQFYGERSCPYDWLQHKNSCYLFSQDSKSWLDSKVACRALGGRLVEVNNSSEDAFLVTVARQVNKSFWIGLSDQEMESQYVWAESGVILNTDSYSNWAPGQPTNCCGGEDCVHIRKEYGFMWNDGSCISSYNFVCEKQL